MGKIHVHSGKRIDDIEKSIGDIMNDLGEEEESGNKREK
jgi:hypothetical protein